MEAVIKLMDMHALNKIKEERLGNYLYALGKLSVKIKDHLTVCKPDNLWKKNTSENVR